MATRMRDSAEIVIVGGGIMGLSIAYNLARHHHLNDIVVVEQSYLCSGASGRNGGGIRAQWSSESNILLMQESLRICKGFALEMGFNVWFHQGRLPVPCAQRAAPTLARRQRARAERARASHPHALA